MVIGINFTGINEDVAALEDYRKALRIRDRIKLPGSGRGMYHRLQGLSDNAKQARDMAHQADNGGRDIVVVPVARGFFAIYIRSVNRGEGHVTLFQQWPSTPGS